MLHTCQIMPLSHVCIALYHEQVSALIYCLIGLSRIMAYLFVSVWPWAINSLWMLRVCAFILHRCICMTGFVFLCVFDTAPFLNVNVMWMRQIYGRCKNSLRLVSLAHHRCHSVLCWSSLAPFIHHMLLTHFFLWKSVFPAKWFNASKCQSLWLLTGYKWTRGRFRGACSFLCF